MSQSNIFRSLRLLGKNSVTLDNVTGSRGEIFYDTTSNTLRLFNSVTRGGEKIATEDWTIDYVASQPSQLPLQAGNSGKLLSTNGSSAVWTALAAGTNISLNTTVSGTITINSTKITQLSEDVAPVLGGDLNALNGSNQYRITNLPNPTLDTEPVTKGYLTTTLAALGGAAPVNASALLGTTIASNVVSSSLTSVGTLTALTVTGATSINNNLTVNGIATPATEYFKITDGATPTPVVKFQVDTANGNTVIQGTAQIVGDTTLNGNITTVGAITSTGNIQTTGSVTASGGLATTGSVSVGGDITAVDNITSTGNYTSTGNVSASGNIVSSGSLSAGSATVTNNVSVGGNVSISTTPSQPNHAATKRYVDNKSIALSIALS
jgi:hypothetical protein